MFLEQQFKGYTARFEENPMDNPECSGVILVGIMATDQLVEPVILAELVIKEDPKGAYAMIPNWFSVENCGIVFVPASSTKEEAARVWLHKALDYPMGKN